jgi:hypothetical protein
MGQHCYEDLIPEHERNTSEDVDSDDGDERQPYSQRYERNWDSQIVGQEFVEDELDHIGENYVDITEIME